MLLVQAEALQTNLPMEYNIAGRKNSAATSRKNMDAFGFESVQMRQAIVVHHFSTPGF
ncbi:MAG TPA: hypothetical protein VHV10_14270 [Ktedonobacteraceae bacterium]|jgi:hypothetical protein|nr:hypothetical protein [Ktedonobacteraceae bacterium]